MRLTVLGAAAPEGSAGAIARLPGPSQKSWRRPPLEQPTPAGIEVAYDGMDIEL